MSTRNRCWRRCRSVVRNRTSKRRLRTLDASWLWPEVTLRVRNRQAACDERSPAMYVAMRMRSMWRLVLATAATSFLVAVVVLNSSSHGASSWQAPACGARSAPSAQVMTQWPEATRAASASTPSMPQDSSTRLVRWVFVPNAAMRWSGRRRPGGDGLGVQPHHAAADVLDHRRLVHPARRRPSQPIHPSPADQQNRPAT